MFVQEIRRHSDDKTSIFRNVILSMHMKNLVKIPLFMLKILNGNEILTSFNGRNSVTNCQKWTLNNPKLDFFNINACATFGQNPFIHTQDIVRKRNSDVIQGP